MQDRSGTWLNRRYAATDGITAAQWLGYVIEEFNPALVVLDSETLAVGKHDEPLRLEPTELAQHNGAVALV